MTEEQFKALVNLINAIVNEGIEECNDAPAAHMLEARKYTEQCTKEARALLVNPTE